MSPLSYSFKAFPNFRNSLISAGRSFGLMLCWLSRLAGGLDSIVVADVILSTLSRDAVDCLRPISSVWPCSATRLPRDWREKLVDKEERVEVDKLGLRGAATGMTMPDRFRADRENLGAKEGSSGGSSFGVAGGAGGSAQRPTGLCESLVGLVGLDGNSRCWLDAQRPESVSLLGFVGRSRSMILPRRAKAVNDGALEERLGILSKLLRSGLGRL